MVFSGESGKPLGGWITCGMVVGTPDATVDVPEADEIALCVEVVGAKLKAVDTDKAVAELVPVGTMDTGTIVDDVADAALVSDVDTVSVAEVGARGEGVLVMGALVNVSVIELDPSPMVAVDRKELELEALVSDATSVDKVADVEPLALVTVESCDTEDELPVADVVLVSVESDTTTVPELEEVAAVPVDPALYVIPEDNGVDVEVADTSEEIEEALALVVVVAVGVISL